MRLPLRFLAGAFVVAMSLVGCQDGGLSAPNPPKPEDPVPPKPKDPDPPGPKDPDPPPTPDCAPWADLTLPDLTLAGMQVLQVIEVGGAIPLITGRPALVRVLLSAGPGASDKPLDAPIAVYVHVTNTEGLDESIEAVGPDCVPRAVHLDRIDSTYNAVIPREWLAGDVTIVASVTGDPGAGDIGPDLRFPEDGPRPYEVVSPPPFHITIVPITYGDIVADIEGIDAAEYVTGWTWPRFPLDGFDAEYRAPLVTVAVEGETWDQASSRMIRELEAARTADGSDRYYFGLLPLEAFSPGGGKGRLGQPLAVGRDRNLDGTAGSGLVAHELGHNFGLQHVPRCDGDRSAADPDYPYERGMTGVYGYDWQLHKLMLPTAGDIMSYCPPWWISDYHYAKILEFRAAEALWAEHVLSR